MLHLVPAAHAGHAAAVATVAVAAAVGGVQAANAGAPTPASASAAAPAAAAPITLDAWWSATSATLRALVPNRLIHIDALSAAKRPQLAVASASARYSLWVLDAELTAPVRPQDVKAAVLILPQGREAEWQFRSVAGGTELARAHGFSRIVFVALNRGQVFSGGLDQVKQELAPLLRSFTPQAMVGSMAIVALGSDVGQRREVFRAPDTGAGALVVEDVLVDEHVHRRLLFEGSGLVQSEARLNVAANFLTMTAAQRKAKAKKKKAAAKKKNGATATTATDDAEADDDAEDGTEENSASAAASTSATASSASALCAPSPSASLICYNHLPCEYQHGLVSMLALMPQSLRRMVLIGLGGGSLSMFLHLSQPQLELHVVELEQNVVDSARRFFGFQAHPTRLVSHVQDGLTFVADLANKLDASSSSSASTTSSSSSSSPSQLLDVLLLDVNNVDLAEGLSFPPPAFLAPDFLSSAVRCLTADGWLLLNLGCRNAPLREQLLRQISQSFSSVFVLQPDEAYVNYIVAATNAPSSVPRDWSTTEQRMRQLQQAASAVGAERPFVWDGEMVTSCLQSLARVQHLTVAEDKFELRFLFPEQAAKEEAK